MVVVDWGKKLQTRKELQVLKILLSVQGLVG